MKKKWIAIVGCGVFVTGLAGVGECFEKPDNHEVSGGTIRIKNQVEADFPGMAKLTFDQSAQKALDAVPGKVLKVNLENENGFLVYGVEVVAADKNITEVMVDAGSGKILAMEHDQADRDGQKLGEQGEEEDGRGK